MPRHLLSETDQERIRGAVARAELQTSGEVVPYLVTRSDTYNETFWKGAVGGALILFAFHLLLTWLYSGWGFEWLFSFWSVFITMLCGGVLGAGIVALFAPLRRWLVGDDTLTRRTHRRALQAFLEENVFDTVDRTGILLFVSLFEHRIEVIGDAGINAKVEQDEWTELVDLMRADIRDGRLADGFVDAVQRCGELLQRRGVARREDDVDELPDDVRLREE